MIMSTIATTPATTQRMPSKLFLLILVFLVSSIAAAVSPSSSSASSLATETETVTVAVAVAVPVAEEENEEEYEIQTQRSKTGSSVTSWKQYQQERLLQQTTTNTTSPATTSANATNTNTNNNTTNATTNATNAPRPTPIAPVPVPAAPTTATTTATTTPVLISSIAPSIVGTIQNSDDSTYVPTRTYSPTSSPLPTFSTKCYVCNGDPSLFISRASFATVVTIFDNADQTAQCGVLESAGRSGLIPPDACDIIIAAVTNSCTCDDGPTNATDTDTSSDVPTPVQVPTISPQPTSSIGEGGYPACYLCGTADRYINNASATIRLAGETLTCRDLDFLARTGNFGEQLCDVAIATSNGESLSSNSTNSTNGTTITSTNSGCGGCSETAPPTPLLTFAPTKSIQPSVSPLPTRTEKCYICGTSSQSIQGGSTNNTETVSYGGFLYTCSELEESGLAGYIDPDSCALFQQRIALGNTDGGGSCTCVDIDGGNLQSDAPTSSFDNGTTTTTTNPSLSPTLRVDRDLEPTTSAPQSSASLSSYFSYHCYLIVAAIGMIMIVVAL